jgi:NNP family nitrate/nitrite transporter-like MFS transporter
MISEIFHKGFGAFKSGHWPSLLGAWLHFQVGCIVWLLIGALGIAISTELGLSATQKGFLVATPLLGGALLRIVVGPFADHFGAKNVGMGLLGLEGLALLMGWGFGSTYLQMLGTGLLLGFAGASFAIALPIASQAYPAEHQGLAMGVAAIGNSGVLVATFFAPRLAEVVGWRGTFGVMIIPVALTALVFWYVIPATPHGQLFSGINNIQNAIRQAVSQRFMYWLCFLYAVTFGGFVGLSSFLPIYFHDQFQFSMITAGTLTALCGLAGSLARPLGGYVADRIGGMVLLPAIFPLLTLVSVILGIVVSPEFVIILLLALLAFLGFGNGVIFQVVSLRYREVMGTATGLIGAAGGIGGFLLPSAFGITKDLTGSYGSGFYVFACLAFFATVSVLVAQKTLKTSVKRT